MRRGALIDTGGGVGTTLLDVSKGTLWKQRWWWGGWGLVAGW